MFDPSKPADHSPLSSAEMRAQFTALKALIDQLQTALTAQNNTIASLQAQLGALTAQGNTIASLQNQLSALTADTPHNCAGVSDLSVSLSQPPNQWEVQPIVDKVNEMLGVMRR